MSRPRFRLRVLGNSPASRPPMEITVRGGKVIAWALLPREEGRVLQFPLVRRALDGGVRRDTHTPSLPPSNDPNRGQAA